MRKTLTLLRLSTLQAFQELRVSRLRSALSLTGITIGIFCIIAVLTVLDSMEKGIRNSVASLGSDVLYVGRRPWTAEDGEYKWWEYVQRRPVGMTELRALRASIPFAEYMALYYGKRINLRSGENEAEGVFAYAVTENFERMQTLELVEGRYMNDAEASGNAAVMVIGAEVAEALFPGRSSVTGETVRLNGRLFRVIGLLKKSGQNIVGFNFDNGAIFPFAIATALFDVRSMEWENNPVIMIKAKEGVPVAALRDEVSGELRTVRRLQPGAKPDFAINELSQVTRNLNIVFSAINAIGWVIGGFSLIVGAFGIANIMFVTVKERTKMIGLKKALGARQRVILTEFLTEAVILCLLGGLIGIGIVLLLSLLMSYGLDFPVALSLRNVFIGLSVSVVVGLLSGFIPAWRASRVEPVVAIRSGG